MEQVSSRCLIGPCFIFPGENYFPASPLVKINAKKTGFLMATGRFDTGREAARATDKPVTGPVSFLQVACGYSRLRSCFPLPFGHQFPLHI